MVQCCGLLCNRFVITSPPRVPKSLVVAKHAQGNNSNNVTLTVVSCLQDPMKLHLKVAATTTRSPQLGRGHPNSLAL